jgi:hypothetical protein
VKRPVHARDLEESTRFLRETGDETGMLSRLEIGEKLC